MNMPQVVPGTIISKAAADLAGIQMFPYLYMISGFVFGTIHTSKADNLNVGTTVDLGILDAMITDTDLPQTPVVDMVGKGRGFWMINTALNGRTPIISYLARSGTARNANI